MEERQLVPVTAAAHPLRFGREIKMVEAGSSVHSIVSELCPHEFIGDVVVILNGLVLPREQWLDRHLLPSDVLTFRATPQGGATGNKILRSILMIAVVAIAFWVLGPVGSFTAGGLFAAGSLGATLAYGIAFAAINAIGNLLINALIPPPSLGNGSPNSTQTFGISGIQNQELQYGCVPRIFGRTLITPPKGAHSYTVATGTDVYLFALFDLGPGPIKIEDIKIGTTPIDDFSGVEYETREGRDSDDPITIFTNAVTQTPLSVATVTNADNVRRTPLNTSHIEVDVTYPGGLFGLDNKGNFTNNTQNYQVQVANLSGTVLQTQTFSVSGATNSMVSQTFVLDDMDPGQYDIHVKLTSSPPSTQQGSAHGYWSALRTWGPADGPLLPQNHAKIAVKIKATEQLNGDISSLNCIAQSYVRVWDGGSMSEELNTHPAWAALEVLTGSSNSRAIADARVDLDTLLEWATTYPSAEFNYVFSQRTTIWQALRTIGPAGRAIPVIRDGLYSFVFDHTQDNPVQMFTARNVSGFKATKTFFDEVDGMEIRYVSETMGWQQHSVYVYSNGLDAGTADPAKISPLNLTGVTSDDWAYKLGSYFFAASVLRPTVYTFDTDLDHIVANPGDRVWVQHDVVGAGVTSGRIKTITRNGSSEITAITFDEKFTGDGASNYAVQIRSADGTIVSKACTVPASEGHVATLTSAYDDSLHPVLPGDLVALSTTTVGLLDAIVKTITPKSDFKATVTLFDYAPDIHNGDEVTPPPVVNDRIKQFYQQLPPSSVVIDFLSANEDTTLRGPGGNNIARMHGVFHVADDGIQADKYELQWKLDDEIGWRVEADLPISTREFWIPIPFQSINTTYDVRIRGNITSGADPGPWGTAAITVGDYTVQPLQPTLTVTPIIGGMIADIVAGGYDDVVEYRLYASTGSTFASADLVAHGTTSPLRATGLTSPNVYNFWATTVNGHGVESVESDPVSAIPLPVGYDALTPDLQDFQNYVGDQLRSVKDTLDLVNQAVDSLTLGSYQDTQSVLTELRATAGALTADYTQQIQASVTDTSAIVTQVTMLTASIGSFTGPNAVADAITVLQSQVTQDGSDISANSTAITSIQSSLNGYAGPDAVANAFSTLTTSVNSLDGTVSALSTSVSGVSAQVGNLYASGEIRMTAQSAPGGASARVAIAAAANSGASANAAAIYLDALTGGATRITMIADQIFLTDGSSSTNPFFFSGGTLYSNGLVVQNIDAANITSGTLSASRIASGSITTAMLQSGIISTSSLIVNGVVITGHLDTNAVTNAAVSTAGTHLISLNSWTTVASITVTTVGGPVLVSCTDYWTWSSNGPRGQLRIIRDGTTQIAYEGVGGGSCPDYLIMAATGLDTGASAGSHTYDFQQQYNAGNQPTSQSPYLVITELKR